MPPISGSILFLSCLSFHNSVWKFNLANNFWTLSTKALIFIFIYEYFYWQDISLGSNIFAHWLWPWSLANFLKTLSFNLLLTVSARTLIFHMNISCDKTNMFYPVTLTTLEFDLFFENFNLVNCFWTVIARASIFYIKISSDKTFLMYICIFLLVLKLLTMTFDLFSEKFTLVTTSEK